MKSRGGGVIGIHLRFKLLFVTDVFWVFVLIEKYDLDFITPTYFPFCLALVRAGFLRKFSYISPWYYPVFIFWIIFVTIHNIFFHRPIFPNSCSSCSGFPKFLCLGRLSISFGFFYNIFDYSVWWLIDFLIALLKKIEMVGF